MTVSFEQLALRQLEDLARLTPGTYFNLPDRSLSLDEAYTVQERIVALRVANGEQIGGYKLGCLGPKIRAAFGMDGPIRGTLFRNEFHRSGAILSCARYANLAIEGEMAVRIGADGTPESIFPILELHHFVLRGEPRQLQELIVNNGLTAGVVLPSVEAQPIAADATVDIEINGRLLDRAALWGFPGGLVETLEWLSKHLASRGLQLEPGQIVLAGTLGNIYPVAPGDTVSVYVTRNSRIDLELRS
jgi:2-keto-4-pentenoate hydratase